MYTYEIQFRIRNAEGNKETVLERIKAHNSGEALGKCVSQFMERDDKYDNYWIVANSHHILKSNEPVKPTIWDRATA